MAKFKYIFLFEYRWKLDKPYLIDFSHDPLARLLFESSCNDETLPEWQVNV